MGASGARSQTREALMKRLAEGSVRYEKSHPLPADKFVTDDHFCQDSVRHILPVSAQPHDGAEMQQLVSALVQVDTQFGITPCEFKKRNGMPLDDGDLGKIDFSNKFAGVDTSKPYGKALDDMYEASGQNSFSKNTQDSAAYRAGAAIGNGLRNIGDGFDEFADAFGDIDLTFEIEGIHIGIDSEWMYDAGEGLYDVTADTLVGTFEFFDGLAVGILGPSVAGRRRVVYDKDCDYIQYEVDGIEGQCSSYRYEKLKQMVPAVKATSRVSAGVTANTTRLNNTFGGDPLSFVPGIREVLGNQRDALYGPNGSCLKPSKGSLGYSSDRIAEAENQLFQENMGLLDTAWTNTKTLDDHMKLHLVNIIQTFTEAATATFNATMLTQATQATVNHLNLQGVFDTSQALLDSVASAVNKLQTKQDGMSETASKKLDEYKASIAKNIAQLEKRMDDSVNTLDASPQGLERFTDMLVDGVTKLLALGEQDVEVEANKQIDSGPKPRAAGIVRVFGAGSDSAVNSERGSWDGAHKTFIDATTITIKQNQGDIQNAVRNMTDEFGVANSELGSKLDEMAGEQSLELAHLRNSAIDTGATMQKLQAKQRATTVGVRNLFDSLNTGNAVQMSDTQTKISQILSVASATAGDQLTAASHEVAVSGDATSDVTRDLESALGEMVYKIRTLLAEAASNSQTQALDQERTLRSATDVNQAKLDSVAASLALDVNDAGDQWEGSSDTAAELLSSVVGDAKSDRARIEGDQRDALTAEKSELSDKQLEAELSASGAAVDVRKDMLTAARSSLGFVRSAGNDLQAGKDSVDQNRALLTNLVRSVSGSGSQSDDQLSSLANQLGKTDEETAADLLRRAQAAARNADNLLEKSTGETEAKQSIASADLQKQLATLVGVVDDSAGRSERTLTRTGDSHDVATQELADIDSDANGIPRDTRDAHKLTSDVLTNDLKSMFMSSQGAAGGVAADAAEHASSVSQSAEGELDAALSAAKAAESRRLADASSEATQQTDKVTESRTTVLQTKQTMDKSWARLNGVLNAVMNMMGEMDTGEQSALSGFDQETRQLGLALLDLNSTVNNQLTNISSTVGSWNASFPDTLGKAVSDFIDSLGANGMRLMDAIVNEAHLKTSSALDGDSAGAKSLETLDSLATVSNGYMSSVVKNEQDLDADSTATSSELASVSTDISKAQAFVKQHQDDLISGQDYADILMKKAAMESDAVRSQLAGSVSATNSSLSLSAKRSDAETKFKADMSGSQSAGLVAMANAAVSSTSVLATEAATAEESSLFQSSQSLMDLQQAMNRKGQALRDRVEATGSQLTEGEAQFLGNISSDKSQVQVQLMMAKRALKTLLSSWDQYVAAETSKFRRMNESDYHYQSLMDQRIESANASSGGSLRMSERGVTDMNDEVLAAVEDYLKFQEYMTGGFVGYREGLHLLNVSSEAGLAQVKEMIYNFNANDEFVDQQRRDDMAAFLAQFNKELDDKANQAKQSVGVS